MDSENEVINEFVIKECPHEALNHNYPSTVLLPLGKSYLRKYETLI